MIDFQSATIGSAQRPGFRTARDLIADVKGGNVDLSLMPPDLVGTCRAAWARLPHEPNCLIHADIGDDNLAMGPNGTLIVYDWDEARADLPCFDLATLGALQSAVAKRAALAYEIACCWLLEPERARRLAATL